MGELTRRSQSVKTSLGLAVAAASLLALCSKRLCPTATTHATQRRVSEVTSGRFFKDFLTVDEFEDPKVTGVKLYISDYYANCDRRDPGSAGVTCVVSGPVKVAADLQPTTEGEDLFPKSNSTKSWCETVKAWFMREYLFDRLNVRRFYDKEAKIVVYVVFTDEAHYCNGSYFRKSQPCAVRVDGVQKKPRKLLY
mmetsp:Transcript_60833/g.112861  ORF Transcript_60833/g.112861 Transcript_60833/m.112861 type:complete len:195 (+) Transcript_60833:72-656(+)